MREPTKNHANRIDWPLVLGPVLSDQPQMRTKTNSGLHPNELADFESACFSYARRAVRPRPEVPSAALPFETAAVPWFERGRFIKSTPEGLTARPGAFLQHVVGDYYIQDAGSMLALALCDVQPGQWVCDTCAAPGGKSTALLEALAGQGLLLANEVIRSRLSILELTLARAGYGNHLLTNLELELLGAVCDRVFDCVLVDAPCTGQTMVASGKQSLAAFSPSQIEHSSLRQQRILRAASALVKPGGRLVYSTCAFSFAENEQIVLGFLQEHSGWRHGSAGGLEQWQSPVAEGCYRVWPHRDGCSGAFAALLVNASDDRVCNPISRPHSPHRWLPVQSLPTSFDWANVTDSGQLWSAGDTLHRFDSSVPEEWIRSAFSGTAIAEYSKPRWKPAFGGATLRFAITPSQVCELDNAQAIKYAGGEAVRCDWPISDWCVAQWNKKTLAWGKMTQGVLKNHFPKALRQSNLIIG